MTGKLCACLACVVFSEIVCDCSSVFFTCYACYSKSLVLVVLFVCITVIGLVLLVDCGVWVVW